ncbi:hypothetical protein F9K33_01870 [bacterium]|nr:MAG: hypothetical protein F9K33_01870 [bacterium]MBL7959695.1 hypothetical protein [bacterium]
MKLLLVLIFFTCSCLQKAPQEKNPNIIFGKIMSGVDSLLIVTKPKNNLIVQCFDFVKFKIRSNEISLVYDTMKYALDSCAAFGVDKNGKPAIIFGKFFIDLYPQNASTAYSILIHEFQHAYDSYINKDLYQISLGNPIEKTYFEMDAATVQAVFIRDYLKNYEISPFEVYLKDNLQFGMTGVSLFFNSTDLDLLHEMDRFKDSPADLKGSMKAFTDMGKSITDTTTFSEERPDWENYINLIRLLTYCYYGPQVAYDIANKKDPKVDSIPDFSFDNYPGVHATILAAQDKFYDNIKYLQFNDRVDSNYNNYFYEAIQKSGE